MRSHLRATSSMSLLWGQGEEVPQVWLRGDGVTGTPDGGVESFHETVLSCQDKATMSGNEAGLSLVIMSWFRIPGSMGA
jgi:hypothetical protein